MVLLMLSRRIITTKNVYALRMFSKMTTRICGTVKNIRRHKYNVFVDIDDGSRVTSVIIPREKFDSSHDQLNCGSSVSLGGDEFDTKGQLICSDLFIDNNCDTRVPQNREFFRRFRCKRTSTLKMQERYLISDTGINHSNRVCVSEAYCIK